MWMLLLQKCRIFKYSYLNSCKCFLLCFLFQNVFYWCLFYSQSLHVFNVYLIVCTSCIYIYCRQIASNWLMFLLFVYRRKIKIYLILSRLPSILQTLSTHARANTFPETLRTSRNEIENENRSSLSRPSYNRAGLYSCYTFSILYTPRLRRLVYM